MEGRLGWPTCNFWKGSDGPSWEEGAALSLLVPEEGISKVEKQCFFLFKVEISGNIDFNVFLVGAPCRSGTVGAMFWLLFYLFVVSTCFVMSMGFFGHKRVKQCK